MPRSSREVLDALAAGFDAIPMTPAEAEEELRAAGYDPDAIGRYFALVASRLLEARASGRCAVCEQPTVDRALCDACDALRERRACYILPDGSCRVPWPCVHFSRDSLRLRHD